MLNQRNAFRRRANVDPTLPHRFAYLQPPSAPSGFDDGQRLPVIGVARSRASWPVFNAFLEVWVAAAAEHADVVVDLVVKETARQLQRQRKDAQSGLRDKIALMASK